MRRSESDSLLAAALSAATGKAWIPDPETKVVDAAARCEGARVFRTSQGGHCYLFRGEGDVWTVAEKRERVGRFKHGDWRRELAEAVVAKLAEKES